jgi:hypothetical protein
MVQEFGLYRQYKIAVVEFELLIYLKDAIISYALEKFSVSIAQNRRAITREISETIEDLLYSGCFSTGGS